MINFYFQICQQPIKEDKYEIRKLIFRDNKLFKFERYIITEIRLNKMYRYLNKNKIKFKIYPTNNLNDVITFYEYNKI